MTLGSILLAAVPAVLIGLILVTQARTVTHREVEDLARERLVAQRSSRKAQVESYLGTLQNQLLTYAEDRMVVESLPAFAQAFAAETEEPATAAQRTAVEAYYAGPFAAEFRKRNSGASPDIATLTRLDDPAVMFQQRLITSSQHPLGSKDALADLADGSRYGELHARYHGAFRAIIQRFGYYDLFLVEPKEGRVVYSVFKETDYATSLRTGPHAASGLGQAFARAMKTPHGEAAVTDLAPYTPSYEDAASFIATKVMDGKQLLGVLIIQMPIDRINAVMTSNEKWSAVGMGKTGEAFLVGADGRMRTNSRFLITGSDTFIDQQRALGREPSVLSTLQAKGTTVGIQPVDVAAARKSADDHGVARYTNYRGEDVFGAVAPVEFGGLGWSIVSEVETSEALAPADSVGSTLFWNATFTSIALIAVAAIAGFLFARRVVAPTLALTRQIDDVARRASLDRKIDVSAGGEIGATAEAMNALLADVRTTVEDISRLTDEMARGDLSGVPGAEYRGDFEAIRLGFQRALDALNDLLGQAVVVTREVTMAAHQLGQSSEALATGANEQTRALESSVAVLQETTAKARGNADKTREADDLIEAVNRAATAGGQEMTDLVASMQAIKKASDDVARTIQVIDEIAFQTNLLALNAAVEAARAGRRGRGFAVVATEVRSLSQKSAAAARDTAELVRESLAAVERGAVQLTNTKRNFDAIHEKVGHVGELVGTISQASKEQARDVATVQAAMEEVKTAAIDAVDQSTRVAAAATELTAQVGSLDTELRRFRLRAGATATTMAQPTPMPAIQGRFTDEMAARPLLSLPPARPAEAAESTAVDATPVDPKAVLPLDEDERGYGDF